MPYVYLTVAVISLVVLVVTVAPPRREPWSNLAFTASFVVGELPLQFLVVGVGVTFLFWWGGAFSGVAFSGVAGWIGLGVAVVDAVVLGWLGWEGLRAGQVVRDALAHASVHSFPVEPDPARLLWCRPWRVAVALPVRGPSIERVKNIDYVGDRNRRQRLDIRRRRGVHLQDAPVLIQVHGGAWVIGEKREQGMPLMHELVARGWVCVAINYRVSPRATWPDHIVDVKRTIAWVREHIAEYGGDPNCIMLTGGSAGGQLSALAALTPDERQWQPGFEDADTSVAACATFYGVYDMTASPEGSGGYGPTFRKLLESWVMKVPMAGNEELYRAASPTERVHPGAPPFMVCSGTNDTLVPLAVSRRFVAALRAVSRSPVAYVELPRAQHAFDFLVTPRSRATTAGAVAFLEAVREEVQSSAPGVARSASRDAASDVASDPLATAVDRGGLHGPAEGGGSGPVARGLVR